MYVLIGLFVFLFCYVLTPIVARLAWKIGAVDVPLDGRRMHRRSIPRDGGVAIFVAFLFGLAVLGEWDLFLTCLAFGSGVMVLVGLADDIFGLGPGAKLLFQVAVATAAVFGVGITEGAWRFGAILWVVLLTNAHNFIDGMDGLLCGCGAIECLMLGACFFIAGEGIFGITSLYLMAACLAFRIFNRYPAHVFAGDSGSEALGFALGMLSLPLFGKGVHLSALAPLFIFAYYRSCQHGGKTPFARIQPLPCRQGTPAPPRFCGRYFTRRMHRYFHEPFGGFGGDRGSHQHRESVVACRRSLPLGGILFDLGQAIRSAVAGEIVKYMIENNRKRKIVCAIFLFLLDKPP